MSKVFVSVGISLDGFIAGLNGGPDNPLGDGGLNIHQWMFSLKSFREHLDMSGGQTGRNNDIVEGIISRIGASIMGKRMFVEGEANWPENAPFHTPVYVLTKEKREPWERKGGTTFYFENEGIYSALEKAKVAAGGKDIRISGGAYTIQQYLNAGLIDELIIHVAPILLEKGVRLFENLDKNKFKMEVISTDNSSQVAHVTFKIIIN